MSFCTVDRSRTREYPIILTENSLLSLELAETKEIVSLKRVIFSPLYREVIYV